MGKIIHLDDNHTDLDIIIEPIHLISLILGVFAVVLSGCQRADNTQTSESKPAQSITKPQLVVNDVANSVSVASTPQPAVKLNIAAASSLKFVLPILVNDFNRTHPHIDLSLKFDTSVDLYENILTKKSHYDIFLSSNQSLPKLVYEENTKNNAFSKYGKPFTYARGQLVLYSNQYQLSATPTGTLDDLVLTKPQAKIVIANPQVSPYGTAAENWLLMQNLITKVEHNIAYQPTVDEAFMVVEQKQADFGFVALSQVINTQGNTAIQSIPQSGAINQPQYAILPKDSYPPIFQDGIILHQSEASQQFVDYLLTAKAQDVLTDSGYLPICVSSNLLPECK